MEGFEDSDNLVESDLVNILSFLLFKLFLLVNYLVESRRNAHIQCLSKSTFYYFYFLS
jgi:hypothetical protein